MTVVFHPEVRIGLWEDFRRAGCQVSRRGLFLRGCGQNVANQCRRRNLKAFPFFILYGLVGDQLIFGSVIPSKSDPLTWLTRFSS